MTKGIQNKQFNTPLYATRPTKQETREVSSCCKADFYDDREFCSECLQPADAIEIPIEQPAKWSTGEPVLTNPDNGMIVLDGDPIGRAMSKALAVTVIAIVAVLLFAASRG